MLNPAAVTYVTDPEPGQSLGSSDASSEVPLGEEHKLKYSNVRYFFRYSQSSRKQTPPGSRKSVLNWSWSLTGTILVRGH